jgi:hypothetical protein
VLADFCDRRDFFQRHAAGKPLHAQVFTKVAHLHNLKTSNVQKRVTYSKVSTITINRVTVSVKENDGFSLYFHQCGTKMPNRELFANYKTHSGTVK